MPSTPTPRTFQAQSQAPIRAQAQIPSRHGGFPHPGSLGFQFSAGWFGWRPYAFYPGEYAIVGPRYVKHEIGDVFYMDNKIGSYAVYDLGYGRFSAAIFPIRGSISMFPMGSSVEDAKQNLLATISDYYGGGVRMDTIWVMDPNVTYPTISGHARPTAWPHSYRWK